MHRTRFVSTKHVIIVAATATVAKEGLVGTNREEVQQLKKDAGLKPYQMRLKDLQESSGEYRAYCPWHETNGKHTPSLAVYKSKDDGLWMFKCMAGANCEKHNGDVIAFVQQIDGLTFPEAMRKIANDIGIAQPEPAEAEGKPSKELSPEQIEQVRQYLLDSGVSLKIAEVRKMEAVVHPKLGLAVAMPYDADTSVIKYRCVGKETSRDRKFAHAKGHRSENLLYNIVQTEKQIEDAFGGAEVYVVESERDCLMMNSLGFMAVSVSSATSCLDRQTGQLKIEDDQLKILARADTIFLALDQDSAGQKCADAFEVNGLLNSDSVKRIKWPYEGKRFEDPKDIGDLYKKNPGGFKATLETLTKDALRRPPKWRQQFTTVGEMQDGEIIQLIEGFLTEGNTGFGGLSGTGKTFLELSITKALTTGQPFLGHFKVPKIYPVLYLIPEVNDRQFKKRLKAFGIPDDDSLFLCRTLSKGTMLPLDHPAVVKAIRVLHNPVVILDTAIRFSKAKDENSATDNMWMAQAMSGLREAGAIAVNAIHHSPKNNARVREFAPSLENTFRGTGDIGALLDIAYNIRVDKDAPPGQQNLIITNVKPRDFDPPNPFKVGLRYLPADSKTGKMHSYIDETGDLMLLSEITTAVDGCVVQNPTDAEPGEAVAKTLAARKGGKGKAFVEQVTKDAYISKRALQGALKMRRENVDELAQSLGFEYVDEVWVDTLVDEPVGTK